MRQHTFLHFNLSVPVNAKPHLKTTWGKGRFGNVHRKRTKKEQGIKNIVPVGVKCCMNIFSVMQVPQDTITVCNQKGNKAPEKPDEEKIHCQERKFRHVFVFMKVFL